jgi:hypothetical protein
MINYKISNLIHKIVHVMIDMDKIIKVKKTKDPNFQI